MRLPRLTPMLLAALVLPFGAGGVVAGGSISGTITYAEGFQDGDAVTVFASTDVYGDNEIEVELTASVGNALAYTIPNVPPGTYFVMGFFGLIDDDIDQRPVGSYADFTTITLHDSDALTGIDFSIAADVSAPTTVIEVPGNGSTISELEFIEGTAADDFALGEEFQVAVQDVTADLWWTRFGQRWISTTTVPLYESLAPDFEGPPGSPLWEIETSSVSEVFSPIGGIAGFLFNGNAYRIYVIAEDVSLNEQTPAAEAVFTWTGPTGEVFLESPSDMTGTVLGVSSVSWSWAAVEGATGFVVSSTDGVLLANVTETAYVQIGLTPNAFAQVAVAASNFYGVGTPGFSQSAVTLAAEPGTPSFSEVGIDGFTVAWSTGGNPPDTGYQVVLSSDGFATVHTAVPLAGRLTRNTTTLTGLDPDTHYAVRVQAYNFADVLSDFSAPSSTRTRVAAPQPPTNLDAVIDPETSVVTLTWEPAVSGTPAVAFRLERSLANNQSFFDVRATTPSSPATDQPGESATFFYRVSGINADGAPGEPSALFELAFDRFPPAPIADLAVTAVRAALAEADLAWTAPADDFSGVDSYEVRYASSFPLNDFTFKDGVLASSGIAAGAPGEPETLTISISTAATQRVAVRSRDLIGNVSSISNLAVLDFTPPTIVTAGAFEGQAFSRPVELIAQAVDDVEMGSITVAVDGVLAASGTDTAFFRLETGGLSDGSHQLTANAADTSGNVAYSTVNFVVSYAPPKRPVITSPVSGTVTKVSTIAVSGTAETGTVVQVLVDNVDAATTAVNASGSWSIEALDLGGEGDLQLTAIAVEPRGFSPTSVPVEVIFASSAPGAPVLLSAAALFGGRVSLDWSPPTVGKTPNAYRLYRSLDDEELPLGGTAPPIALLADNLTELAYTDTPPSEDLWFYAAASLDSAGNESLLSENAHAFADAGPPTAAVALPGTTPPVGPGEVLIELVLSDALSEPPLLTFDPDPTASHRQPIPLSLEAVTATLWRTTLTVTSEMPSGDAAFSFQGTDLAGNVGNGITAGSTLALDTDGPIGTVSLSKASPVNTGTLTFTLTLDEPAGPDPALSFRTLVGTTVQLGLTESLGSNRTIWTGDAIIDAAAGEGPATLAYSAEDGRGNGGVTLSGGVAGFSIDTIAPGEPLAVHAQEGPGGTVVLTWSPPFGEDPTRYKIYRDSVAIGTAMPLSDGTGTFTDIPPQEGVYQYAVSSLDDAGNESTANDPPAAADFTAPEAPVNLTAVLNEFGQIVLEWASGDPTTEKYRLYAALSPISDLDGLTPRPAVSPFTETPQQDGTFHFVVTALDAVGNESGPSTQASLFFDQAPPVITISGIANGAFADADVTLTFSAADASLDSGSVQATLDGAPFASGGVVGGEGPHTLVVDAADTQAHASRKSLAFTLDKTAPRIDFIGVSEGQILNAPQGIDISIADLNPAASSFLLTNTTLDTSEPYTSGASVTRDGFYVLSATATDRAGHTATGTLSFRLDIAPIAPTGLSLTVEEGSSAILRWIRPEPDTIGYRVFRDGNRISAGIHAGTSFKDTGFPVGVSVVYEVAGIDAAGREGARALVTVPAVTLTLEPLSLTRGFFDTVGLRVHNDAAASLFIGPAAVEILAVGRTVSTGTVFGLIAAAGQAVTLEGAVASPPDLPDAVTLRVNAAVQTSPGASLSFIRSFPVQARDPQEPIIEVFPESFVPGTESPVRVRFHNRGTAAIDIVTSEFANSTFTAVPDVSVRLKTPAGTLFAQGGINQSGAGTFAAKFGVRQFRFISIPGNSSVLFEAVRVLVPVNVTGELTAEAVVSTPTHSLAFNSVVGTRDFRSSQAQAVVSQVPYRATAFPDSPVYDQGSSVTVRGRALDEAGNGAADVDVLVHVRAGGFDRTVSARTDADGGYAAGFFPSPNEAGIYNVFAAHPDVITHAVQSTFTIVGLTVGLQRFSVVTAQGASVPIGIDLFNTGATPVTGLTFSTLPGTAAGITLALDTPLPDEFPAGGRASMRFTATAAPDASAGTLIGRITESNGFSRDIVFDFAVHPAQVIPEVTPRSFSIGMLGGATVSRIITLKNLGFTDWRGVSLTPPAESWVTVQGGVPSLGNILLGDIPPGGNASFALTFSPPSSLPNGVIASRPLLTVLSSNADPIPIVTDVGVTSSLKGNLLLSAVNADEPRNSNTGAGVPVPGAKVTITSLEVPGLSFADEGDANGLARFADIPSGNYAFRAEKPGFQTKSGVARIEPGLTTETLAVLVTAVVTYEWSVTPTTIQDKYDITLGLTFKTNVPAPAIIVDPPVIDLNINAGETAFSEYTIKNAGLVRAFNLKIRPGGNNPKLKIETPFTTIDVLEPGQSVTVPLKITAIQTSCPSDIIQMECTYSCPFGTDEVQRIESVRINAGNTCGVVSTPVTTTSGGGAGSFTIASAPTFYVSQSPAAGGTVTQCAQAAAPADTWLRDAGCSGTNPATGGTRTDGGTSGAPGGSPDLFFWLRHFSLDPRDSPLGFGWASQFLELITFDENGNLVFKDADGSVRVSVKVADFNPFLSGGGSAFSSPVFTRYEVACVGGSSSKEGVVTIREADGTVVEYVPNLVLKEERDAAVQARGGCGSSINPPVVPAGVQFRPAKKTDRNGNTVAYEYAPAFGPDSRLAKITDIHGRTLAFTHTPQGRIASVTDSAGRTTQYGYNAAGDLTSETDANGDATQYAYDVAHRVTEITYPNGGQRRYVYDAQGRVLSEEDVDAVTGINKNSYEYFGSSTIVTDVLGRSALYEYLDVEGLRKITKIVDARGGITAFEYDTDMRLTRQTDPLGRSTHFRYDDKGNLTAATDPSGRTTTLAYELKFNQATNITDARGNATPLTYDARGNLLQVRDALGSVTQMGYDVQGHVTGTKDPLGNVTGFAYNGNGALTTVTDPLNRTTVMARDALSRVVENTDPKLKNTAFEYDPIGNLTRVSDHAGGVTSYTYVPGRRGRLLKTVTDAKGQITTFTYDLLDRLTSVKNALNQEKTFTYDAVGNLKSVTDAKGQNIAFEYDPLDRLVKKSLPATTTDPGGDVLYEYDLVGNLTKVANPNGSIVQMSYDALDRVIESKQTLPGGFTATLSYAYDANGNRTQMTTPWGNFSYAYDVLNRVTNITNPDARTIGFQYDALGRRTKLIYPNGIETTYAYDAAGQLAQILHRRVADNTAVAFFDYTYDQAGNRTSMTDLNGVHLYDYDDLHRLTEATHPEASAIPTKTETFSYDGVGNRLADAHMSAYQYDAGNRLLENSSFTYAYDGNGNQTGKTGKEGQGTTAYAYDSENQLNQVDLPDGTVSAYKYDGLGRRIEKSTGPIASPTVTRYIYDNEDILAMLDGQNNLVALFTHGPSSDDESILTLQSGEFYSHHDALQSISGVTNSLANMVSAREYSVYGNLWSSEGQSNIEELVFAFVGRERDLETGLYFHQQRYYDAFLGRFIQADPEGFGEIVSPYIYADNSPVVLVDRGGSLSLRSPLGLGLGLLTAPCLSKAIAAWHVGSQVAVAGNDEFAHCFVSCEISQNCGGENIGRLAGFLWESFYAKLGMPFEESDLAANDFGAELAKGNICSEPSRDEDAICINGCMKRYGR